MASSATLDKSVPAAWPPLVALGVVVVLSIGSLGVDLYIDRQTADRTAELIDNSMRSIALADDLRYQAYRLSAAGRDPEKLASIAEQIAVDARAYDPIATDDGERAEWTRLQGLLAHLQHDGQESRLLDQIAASISHLVEINQRAAREGRDVIASTHRDGLWIDMIVGGITAVLAGAVALVFLGALRRQRALLAMHLTSLGERAVELEAFAARTSHDLKGPLSPLRGYADMLADHESPRVREIAGRIRRAADRMTGIVENLLSLSVSGRLEPGKVGVTPVVLDLLDEFQSELRDAEVAVALGDCATACNAGVLEQVLRNLISNATKYRAANRRLVLRLEARRTGDNVEIVVSDNGLGMEPEAVSRAFEPYFRANGTTVPGHGLGLSIVKRTIAAIGGTCSLSSIRDVGTRVTIQLPAAG
jgi:signal transduction histidine kinase